MEYRNRTVYRNTEIKMIYLYRFHSNPIRAIFRGIFPVENPGTEGKGTRKGVYGTTRNFTI
ncbi:phosphoglycerate mutase [Mediterraneibacter catenae]|uniref:Phosphoglycerate mutase n=1 Tax=Mediterraneibacter catenae TaxID=2594882 RepID=A0A5M9I271_9FIRM|nr:phosphoglycerate mutase [Mediterraneibacter catenae]